MSPCWAGQLIPVLSEAATKHFNSSGIYENQTVIEQRGCFFIWKEWKVRLILMSLFIDYELQSINYAQIIPEYKSQDPKRNKGKFISDMHIEIYRYEDYLQYPLNRTSALCKFSDLLYSLISFLLVHEMAHAWHAMLDYENEDLLENFSRVNETGIYEGLGFKEN